MKIKNKLGGFTLIELLVVISIIGILASIIMTSINGARQKARNSLRRQTLSELQKALNIYYSTNGSYPSTGGTLYTSTSTDPVGDNGGDWIPGLVASGAIAKLPQDPLNDIGNFAACGGAWKRSYAYRSDNGTGYMILSHCAPEGSWTTTDPMYDPNRPDYAWKVCLGNECSE